jgi:endonuclease/exonuclease/phosphatase family metal-dependent hydrolase
VAKCSPTADSGEPEPEAEPATVTAVRVMTWNVQNLFDAGSADGPTDMAAFTNKVTALATVIDALRPDVAVLQEVGQDAALAALHWFQKRASHLPEKNEPSVAMHIISAPLYNERIRNSRLRETDYQAVLQ